jgi:uncharacterized protein
MKASVQAHRPNKDIADLLVDHRRILVSLVGVVTVVLLYFVPGLDRDPSLRSAVVTGSEAYSKYSEYIDTFGNEEFLLVAVKNQRNANDQRLLASLTKITNELEADERFAEVLSITNLRLLQKKGDKFGDYPLIQTGREPLRLPEPQTLQEIRNALPLIDLLISGDLSTAGVLIRVQEQWRFDPDATEAILSSIGDVVRRNLLPGSEFRVIGPAAIRQAILRNAVTTAVLFYSLCTLICASVTYYVFRSFKVTIATIAILSLCVLWVLGLMSLLGIPLNATTSSAFGLLLIATLEIVIHMVTRYNQFREIVKDRTEAIKETVRFLARPFLFCSATTAVGFGCCMITSVPMIFQLGFTMVLGIMTAFLLTMILMPAYMTCAKSLDRVARPNDEHDLFSRAIATLSAAISEHHKLFTVFGIAITLFMFSGTPLIRTDPQFVRLLGDSSPEVKAIKFVEQNLTAVHSLELMLESDGPVFKDPEAWKRLAELDKRLRNVPEVVTTDSLLSGLVYAYNLLGNPASNAQELFEKPELIPQLLFLMSMGTDGRQRVARYLNADFSRLRMTIRIRNTPSVPIGDTINRVASEADSVMKGIARPTVTGELAVVAMQGEELIRASIYSMIIALVLITGLLMIQMGTPLFGLISLAPNIPPIATVFGIMGWLGVPLDGQTIFAATVAVGLAVDNTIQYVAQLKREMRRNPELDMEQLVFQAYRLAAKPMASWSIVTFLGMAAMVVIPYKAAVAFGLLVAAAVLMGMFGDLIFMQSIILTVPWVRNLLKKLLEKELAAERNL